LDCLSCPLSTTLDPAAPSGRPPGLSNAIITSTGGPAVKRPPGRLAPAGSPMIRAAPSGDLASRHACPGGGVTLRAGPSPRTRSSAVPPGILWPRAVMPAITASLRRRP